VLLVFCFWLLVWLVVIVFGMFLVMLIVVRVQVVGLSILRLLWMCLCGWKLVFLLLFLVGVVMSFEERLVLTKKLCMSTIDKLDGMVAPNEATCTIISLYVDDAISDLRLEFGGKDNYRAILDKEFELVLEHLNHVVNRARLKCGKK